MKPIKIQIIIGSTRDGRYGDKPAHWMLGELKSKEGIEAELIDLRDWPLPFFNEALSPSASKGDYKNELAKKWAAKIAEADAYIFTVAEYNHGYTAVLKNAIDWLYAPWVNKPAAFIGYGGVGGARAIQQLKQVLLELQVAPIRNNIHIPLDVYIATMKETAPANPELFAPLKEKATGLITQLLWWANALRDARNK